MSRHNSVLIGLAATAFCVLSLVTPWASRPNRANAAEALGLTRAPEPLAVRPAGEAALALAPALPVSPSPALRS